MKAAWIRKSGGAARADAGRKGPGEKKLLVFFGGFACDDGIMRLLRLPDNCDVLMLCDYENLECELDLESVADGYGRVGIVAWSFGLGVAEHFPRLMSAAGVKVALCSSPCPIDDERGISRELFRKTLDNLDEAGLAKFFRRVCGFDGAFGVSGRMRPAERLRRELEFLGSILDGKSFDASHWTWALGGRRDRIFYPRNLERAWGGRLILAGDAHFDIRLFEAAFALAMRPPSQFERSAPSYDSSASVQREICAELERLFFEALANGDLACEESAFARSSRAGCAGNAEECAENSECFDSGKTAGKKSGFASAKRVGRAECPEGGAKAGGLRKTDCAFFARGAGLGGAARDARAIGGPLVADKSIVDGECDSEAVRAKARARVGSECASDAECAGNSGNFAPKKILEIGCGTGLLTRIFAARFPGADWTLNDESALLAARAASFLPGARIICGDAASADLGRGYDLILSSSCFQWIGDSPAFYAKLFGILNPGGLLAFSSFGEKNFRQTRELSGRGLDYMPFGRIVSVLGECGFSVLLARDCLVQREFESPREVLRHIRATGVNGGFKSFWTPGVAAEFFRRYAERFPSPGGGVFLDYNPVYVVAAKEV